MFASMFFCFSNEINKLYSWHVLSSDPSVVHSFKNMLNSYFYLCLKPAQYLYIPRLEKRFPCVVVVHHNRASNDVCSFQLDAIDMLPPLIIGVDKKDYLHYKL